VGANLNPMSQFYGAELGQQKSSKEQFDYQQTRQT